MGQMVFTKYIVVVGDEVDVHNTSEVLFRLCANTDPQRDSIFRKDHRTFWTMRPLKSRLEQSWELMPRESSRVRDSRDRGRR